MILCGIIDLICSYYLTYFTSLWIWFCSLKEGDCMVYLIRSGVIMVELLLFISLFFVILSSALCSTYLDSLNGTMKNRACVSYNRCRRSREDILESNSRMSSGQNLTSDGGNFRVGFFVRGENIYLGTWYTWEEVIVWVANRDNPIPSRLGHNCSLVLGEDGAAVVLDSNHHPYWSIHYSTASNPYLQILDTGNLILVDTTGILWQSFHEPTDTFLPGMEIMNLTSWKSGDDPAQGNYLLQRSPQESLSLVMVKTSHSQTFPQYYWDSSLSSLPTDLTALLSNNLTKDSFLRLVMNSTATIQLWHLHESWSLLWEEPGNQCDLYKNCGGFGVCNPGNGFKCKCLPGFQPSDPVRWESNDFSSGCSKKSISQCGQVFWSLPMIKLPPHQGTPTTPSSETDCKNQCLNDCGCKAYAIDANQTTCFISTNELTHIQEEYYNLDAVTLYVRLNQLDIDSGSRTCSICGTNVIPYPLSTNSSCGDPTYFNFECNHTNGQLYFKPSPNGMPYYKVSLINPEHKKFTLQLVQPKCADNIGPKVLNLNSPSPFKVTNCSIVTLMGRPPVVEVELVWKPPPSPVCNSTADCKDWPQTTCDLDKDRKKVCFCTNGFNWDSTSMNCTRDVMKLIAHPDQKHNPLLLKVGIACGTVLFLLTCTSFVIYIRRRLLTHTPPGTVDQFKMDDMEDIDIPFIDYQSIVAATDNFSDTNKLGAGGFGPVYKGMLGDANEVAIKRLSAASAQGVLEFRNEIVLIAKLQHRNLVRVLGYCIQEDEKILIYEYMPNKSLDSFIFDPIMSTTLDWIKRFDIIVGIARGLVYLHQDSRLRIIHRDLKPSNILLDEELNPKISDFGLAKIIAGKDMATSTARVIGTYGYMSPEYALEGYFSVKSDVYSFGIIVIEVISGKRCTSLLQGDNNLISLLGYVWALWKEGKELELVDESIADTCNSIEVKRCINVALLCVQEDPSDRPTMSNVLLMLDGDSFNFPDPKQPVFVARRQPSTSTSSSKFGSGSNVDLTTTVDGR